MDDDWSLVYASFQSQYGIRLSKDLSDMSWREFSYLVNGLSGETPLGKIVAIRAENDPEVIKDFSNEEKKIRREYRVKKAKQMDRTKADKAIEDMRKVFVGMANDEKAEV